MVDATSILKNADCVAKQLGFLQFAFPTDGEGKFAEVVEYDEANNYSGLMSFGKR